MKPLPDTRAAVLWGSLAAGFLVAQQVTGKATRDAFFLSHHPATALPLVMMASALLAVVTALCVGRLLSARAPRVVVPALVGTNAALLLGAFVLARRAPGLASVLVYLQIAAGSGSLLSGFWSVANERFDPWTAKRMVGRLALGASLGGVGGGLVAFAAAGAVPLSAMLVFTAALNVAALVGLVRFGADTPDARPSPASGRTSAFATLRATPYLQLLALLVGLGAGAEALLDYVLKSSASQSLAPGQPMMAFFAAFHTGVGLLALAGQTFLTRPALRRLGLAGTVALRPLGVMVAALVGAVDLRLWSALLGRGSHDVLSSSLFRSGYELLYTPLPEREKRATKQVVDVAFDKLGALLGGAVALLAVRFVAAPERLLLLLVVGLSLLALGITRRLQRGYVATLEQALRAGKLRLEPDEVVDATTRATLTHTQIQAAQGLPETPRELQGGADWLAGAPAAGPLAFARGLALHSGDAERVREALRDPDLSRELVPYVVPLLGRDDVYPDVLKALKRLAPECTGQLLDTLLDPEADLVVRRRLARVLKAAPGPRAREGLLHGLDEARFEIRAACAAALAGLEARAPQRVPAELVFGAVRRELDALEQPAPGGIQAPIERQARLDHVFNLLALVLDREPLRIAAWALRGDDAGLQGTALEYLENVLPHELRFVFLRFVGAPLRQRQQARSRQELVTELLRRGASARRQALRPPG